MLFACSILKVTSARARPAPHALAFALALVPAGCGLQEVGREPAPVQDAGVSGPDATIRFEESGTITLVPGDPPRTLTVMASPPAAYEVRFVLLGDALDATLDRTVVVADGEGRASVELLPPSTSTTFRVRASIKDGPSVETAVAASDQGFGTLRIMPEYAGTRPVGEWVTGVAASQSCADLLPGLPGEAEGAIIETAKSGELPVIVESVPVGPKLAITLRAGHYIAGCSDEAHLVAGQPLDVTVKVIDEPMDLAATSLDLDFSYQPTDPNEHGAVAASATAQLVDAAFPEGVAEPATLLDAMQAELLEPDSSAFAGQRDAGQWDAAAQEHWQAQGVSLRVTIAAWAAAGLPTGAPLLGHLDALGDAGGQAMLTLTSFAGIDAPLAGVPAAHLVTWSADPDDTVHLGGTLYWMPSRLAGTAALLGAQQAMPGVQTAPEALALTLDCGQLAGALGGFGACDTTCLATLCEDALAARFAVGLDGSAQAGRIGEISINASGPALVSDTAAPVSFEGSWVGEVSDGVEAAKVGGAAKAITTTPKDPPK